MYRISETKMFKLRCLQKLTVQHRRPQKEVALGRIHAEITTNQALPEKYFTVLFLNITQTFVKSVVAKVKRRIRTRLFQLLNVSPPFLLSNGFLHGARAHRAKPLYYPKHHGKCSLIIEHAASYKVKKPVSWGAVVHKYGSYLHDRMFQLFALL